MGEAEMRHSKKDEETKTSKKQRQSDDNNQHRGQPRRPHDTKSTPSTLTKIRGRRPAI
jgi:hypothetical protein